MNLNAGLSSKEASTIPFLLIHPGPFRESYANVPYGLAVIASILQMNKIPVFVKDYMAEPFNINELFSTIIKNKIKIIGFSFMTPQADWTYALLSILKKEFPDIIYICGGAHPSFLTKEPLERGFRFVFKREAEESLTKFIPLLLNNKFDIDSLLTIKGLAFLENNCVTSSGPAKRITDLDSIPFPARHLFKFPSNYKPQIPLIKGYCAQFFSSRGCPSKCKFCAEPYRDGIFFRSPENIVDEIEQVKKDFKISHFYINDDSFCHDNNRVIKISELMIKRNLNLPWVSSFATIKPVSLEMFKAMRKSGCQAITFGVESGDPTIRNEIYKDGTLEEVTRAVRLAQKGGLIAGVTFMFGHPTETKKQANNTILFSRKLAADYNKFFINTPYPGSADYTYFKKNNLLLTNKWSDYWIQDKPIIETKYLTTKELINLKHKAFILCHLSLRWWIRQLWNILRLRNFGLAFRFMKNMFMEYFSKGLAPSQKNNDDLTILD